MPADDEVRQLWRLREAAVEAYLWGADRKLFAVLRSLAKLRPSRAALRETGAGFLVMDRTMWSRLGTAAVVLAQATAANWKRILREPVSVVVGPERAPAPRPFAGLRAQPFADKVRFLFYSGVVV